MNTRNVAYIFGAVAALTLAGPTGAQQPPDQTAQAQPVSGKGFDLSITPRVQYLIYNVNAHSIGSTSSYDSAKYPFYGATLTVSPNAWQNTDILLSGFHGSGDGKGTLASGARVNYTTDRSDAELLIRHGIKDTTVSLT